MSVSKPKNFPNNQNREKFIKIPIIIVLCLMSIPKVACEVKPIIDYYNAEDSFIQIITPEIGHGDIQKNHFIVWESSCLIDPYKELAAVKSKNGDIVDHGKDTDAVTNLLENFERLLVNDKIFKKMDITPFLESIENRQNMGATEFKNTTVLTFNMIFLTAVLGLLITISVFTCTHLKRKLLKRRPKCIKCCFIFLILIIIVMGVLVLITLSRIGKMSTIQNELVCEATRLPHTIFFGSPEIHYEIEAESKFLGLETIRIYIINFLNQYTQLSRGSDSEVLKEIKDISVSEEANVLALLTQDFKKKYETKKVLNSESNHGIPQSITHSLPLYMLHQNSMVESYQLTSKRADNINILSPIFESIPKSDQFRLDLKIALSDIEDMQSAISTFWNDVMRGAFDSTVGYQVAVGGLGVICLVLWIAVLASTCVFRKRIQNEQMKGKYKVRFLMILVLFLSIFAFIALFDVNRGTFTSFYGCSTLYQIREDPQTARPLIEKHLMKDEKVLRVFQKCYFDAQANGNLNFYDLFDDSNSKQSIESVLAFMDALKVFHDEVQGIRAETDRYHTRAFEDQLLGYKNGLSYEFTDVFRNLSLLNYNFTCSKTSYGLTAKTCQTLPEGKEKCIPILTGEFSIDSCLDDDKNNSSRELFDGLKKHMEAEQVYIDEILDDLVGPNNENSILGKIEMVLLKFGKIDANVQKLKTDLHVSFKNLASGHLEDWLDCAAIKRDINTTYEKLCGHYLMDMVQFGDMAFFILFFVFVTILMLFILTFCYKDQAEYFKAQSTANDLNRTQDFEENMETEGNMMRQDTEEDAFANFGTFKTPEQNPKQKSNEDLKGDRVDLDRKYKQFGESDDEDPFNERSNEFDFKK